jgi:hypothetical protein
MAGRGPQTFKKRQKEQQRKEKQQEKMARRLQRKQDQVNGVERSDSDIEADDRDDLFDRDEPTQTIEISPGVRIPISGHES